MKKVLFINTGGTFNKIYDPIKGVLVIEKNSHALKDIASKWLCDFEILNILGKDSLDINTRDRLELLATITQSDYENIIIIHGTDTMELTAQYLDDSDLEKNIIMTGAMVPYAIEPTEATANLASSVGYMQAINSHGIYIVMNGVFGLYNEVKKDRQNGKFILS